MIQSTVYARVGLAGNPSDGFYGKCLSACVQNWSATVSLESCDRIIIEPNHEMDATTFVNLAELTDHADKYGYDKEFMLKIIKGVPRKLTPDEQDSFEYNKEYWD